MISLRPYSKQFYEDLTESLSVLTLPCRSDNYTYLILSPGKDEAVLVDCADHKKTLDVLESLKLNLTSVLLTHHHFDHVDGLDVIFEHFPSAKFYCTKRDQERKVFKTQGEWVKEGDQIQIFDESAEVVFTPGHTTSHVSYYLKKSNALFCGDLIFSLGCGRVFEPYEQVYEDFFKSIEKVKRLTNDKTQIFCAHEYTKKNLEFHDSLGALNSDTVDKVRNRASAYLEERTVPTNFLFEKEHNVFLRARSSDEFKRYRELKDRF
jgi:hydroxyacylglutathione hydrolase